MAESAIDAFEAGHQSRKRSTQWAADANADLLAYMRDAHQDEFREFWRGYYYPHDDVPDDDEELARPVTPP